MVAKAHVHRREASSRRKVGQEGAPTTPYPRAGSHWKGKRGQGMSQTPENTRKRCTALLRTTILWSHSGSSCCCECM
eukprot:5530073-Prymnesium_polylepis.1